MPRHRHDRRRAATRALSAAACLALAATCTRPTTGATVAAVAGPATAPAATGMLLVANQASANASIVDLATGAVTHLDVGVGPHEAAISPDGRWGVVTVYGNQASVGRQLAVIDMKAKQVVRTIDLGEYHRPHDVVFLPGSSTRVVATSEASQNVVVVDIAAGRVEGAAGTRAAGSHMLALAGDGKTLFTANIPAGNVSQLDLAARSFARHIPVAPVVEGIAITPDGRELWVGSNQAGTVSVIETASGSIVATLPALGVPYRIGISPSGRWAAIADPQGNRLHVADVAARTVVGEIAGIGSPRGVDIAADDRTAFATLGPEGAVVVVDLQERTVLARYQVGAAPDGVAWGRRPE